MLEGVSDIFSSKLRLGVIASLISGEKDFAALRELTSSTDGNLGRQLERLCAEGFVLRRDVSTGKRPRSVYCLTDFGRAQFRAYVELLESVLSGGV